jgi:ribulose-5-phosphate 4-epimerase/fuculose-1-phosphate aldolase
MNWVEHQLVNLMERRGYRFLPTFDKPPEVVFLFIESNEKKPLRLRRHTKKNFVVGIHQREKIPEEAGQVIRALYPTLIRSMVNILVCFIPPNRAVFVTPEQGIYEETSEDPEVLLELVYERIKPIITSHYALDFKVSYDLPEHLWEGNEQTQAMRRAGRWIGQLGLLATPFPLARYLDEESRRELRRIYGILGVSYGNLSTREPTIKGAFWMSGSGVDKSNLKRIGYDILLVTGYDEKHNKILISAPSPIFWLPVPIPDRALLLAQDLLSRIPKGEWSPINRPSVDAIEHWMIYQEHPEVGAIVHIHGWMKDIPVTPFNYPCGTLELAQAVVEKVRQAPDPSRAVVGLKNHGLTITGPNLEDILSRIEGKVFKEVPKEILMD